MRGAWQRMGRAPETARRPGTTKITGDTPVRPEDFPMKAMPKVDRYMTTSPHTIGIDQPLSQAHAVMSKHRIRHLPVLRGGALVGVITDRDLHLIETLKDVDPTKVTVEEAMTASPYSVAPDAALDEVAAEMAERKYGCAVVMDNHHVVGVLTTVDVARALAEVLRQRFH
jgi:acetoin utilization protein AcuB